MLKYKTPTDEGFIYPYRVALAALRETETINYHEFLYALYSVQPNKSEIDITNTVIQNIITFRNRFPNSEISSESNKEKILVEMNLNHPVGFSFNDVWTDRTTTGNQYRYFRRHLELFDDIIEKNNHLLQMLDGCDVKIEKILNLSKEIESEDFYNKFIWIE